MKLTSTQLKKIIAEEVKAARRLQEANPMMMSPRHPGRQEVKLRATFYVMGDRVMVDWTDSEYVEENSGTTDDLLDYVHTELEAD